MKNDKRTNKGGLSHNPVIITVKRSISLGKTHMAIAIVIALVSLFLLNSLSGAALSAKTAGISPQGLIVPLMVLPTIILVTPVVLLYVYDKNNGVLEYFLSLGMTQKEIYERYLKAALLIVSIFLIVDVTANLVAGFILRVNMTVLTEAVGLASVIALAAVSLLIMIMISFSSLQKTRMGANQPLGLIVGFLMVLPDYGIPFIQPYSLVVPLELTQAVILTIIAITMLVLSNRLINRENLLP
jgi:hypothetical protein